MAKLEEREAEKKWATGWGGYIAELKKGSRIAAPMVAVTVLQYLVQVVSVIMVGHLGQLSLSSVAIATSLTNITGFSLLEWLVDWKLYVGKLMDHNNTKSLESILTVPSFRSS
ncbi:hypothetical protein J1N35_028434 [Gossypium stocksii]|uniref:MATE efflux family protein n=1 Tax=Gossypium stocksii TaxID=47602 RepID=A0A9D3UWA6_9ROSI|nr:hypothetical protein J1N35_028434 [Gossypium stocksii]